MIKLKTFFALLCLGMYINLFPGYAAINQKIQLADGLSINVGYGEDVSSIYILSAVTLGIIGKVAYDVSWHGEYVRRVQKVYEQCMAVLPEQSINDKDFEALLYVLDDDMCLEIATLESWLFSSYDNWISIWNWMPSQKAAFEKIMALSALAQAFYVGGAENEDEMIQVLRRWYSSVSIYPLKYAGNSMSRHLQYTYTTLPKKLHQALLLSRKLLCSARSELLQSKQYVDDIQAYQLHQSIQAAARR